MNELHLELTALELNDLELDALDFESVGNEKGLESLTTGHGMVEIGASVGDTACCSCCLVCCCCCA